MTPKERLKRQALGQDIDRIPTIGGWMNGVENLAHIAGIGTDEYLLDPTAAVVKANKALAVDGIVFHFIVPERLDQIRSGAVEESRYAGIEPEALVTAASAIPDTEAEILAKFDAADARLRYRHAYVEKLKAVEGIELIANHWELGGNFPLYHQFGYEAFLLACTLYPQAVGKIWWAHSVVHREIAKIIRDLMHEFDLAPVLLCGEDVCNNKGPMVSPEFLREHYWPTVRRITGPLVDDGIRLVYHCDGDVRLTVDDYIASGFSGLQGFQYEVGVDPFDLRQRRPPCGEHLLFFAGLSVTRTMPYGTPDDIFQEIDYMYDYTDGGKGMFLFSSNVTGVEVPPDNIQAAYAYAPTLTLHTRRPFTPRPWPWTVSHPETR